MSATSSSPNPESHKRTRVCQLEGEVIELQRQLARSERRVKAMQDIGCALGSSLELDPLLDKLVRRVTDLLEVDRSTLFLVDVDTQQLWSKVLEGQEQFEIRLPMGHGLAGWVAQTGQSLSISDAYHDARFDKTLDLRTGYHTRDILTWPVRRPQQSTVIGVVQALNKRSGTFDASDFSLMEAIASEIGVALEVATLHQEALARRKEQAQQERLSTIGQMLSGILHDFRTPMTLISGYTQLMVEMESEPERLEHAELVDRQIHLLTTMTKELLDFAKGQRSVLKRKVFVGEFMREMEDYLRTELYDSNISLHLNVGYQGSARFDAAKMRRVFHNIARNAREAMVSGGNFWVTVQKRADDSLIFLFEDDGPGIPQEIEARLFEPFASLGKKDGTGLGLALVKQIADDHQGTINYRHRQSGGAMFELLVPFEA